MHERERERERERDRRDWRERLERKREREREREREKVFEAHSVPVHAWWRFVVVDARQKKLDVVVGPNEGIFEHRCKSSSCKHPRIVLSEDDRIGYYPQTFRIVFTSSSCKRGLILIPRAQHCALFDQDRVFVITDQRPREVMWTRKKSIQEKT